MKFSIFGTLLAVSGLAALNAPIEASFYPPNYVVQQQCLSDGPVTVCAWNKDYNIPRLYVAYKQGYLVSQEGQESKISAWVKLNGRDGTYKLNHANYGGPESSSYEWKAIGEVQNLTCCFNYDPAPEDEKKIFFYAYDTNGKANAWDVEVAIVAENGHWDSKYGQNYKFRLA